MGGHNARTCWESRGLTLLWLAVLSGPAAWTLNLLVGYALVKPVCANHSSLTLPVLSVVALVMSLGGAWLAWTFVARLRGRSEERRVGKEGRRRGAGEEEKRKIDNSESEWVRQTHD